MIIHKSILKELIKNMSVIIFSLSIILFMEKFVKLTKLFMGKGADLLDIFKIFLYIQPSILLLSVPMAILISIFLTYGRMAADNEIIVLKSTGMTFLGISRAAFTISFISFAALLFISLYLLPRSTQAFNHTLHQTIVKKASMTLEAESFSDVFKGTVIFINKMPSQNTFNGIFVYREGEKAEDNPFVIVAEKGLMSSDPDEGLIKLTMKNGSIHSYKKDSSSEISFSEYDFILTTGIKASKDAKPDEIRTSKLWDGRKSNLPWAIELNRRLALPFACLIFGFLAPSLSHKTGKIGKLGGFSISLTIIILYYMFLIMGEGLSKSGGLTPFLGSWLPNIFFSAIAAVFVYFAYIDKPLRKL
jgi:lipopolysaccharide export system permease protein